MNVYLISFFFFFTFTHLVFTLDYNSQSYFEGHSPESLNGDSLLLDINVMVRKSEIVVYGIG